MPRMTSATQYVLQSLIKLFPVVIYSYLFSNQIKYYNNLQDIFPNKYINFHDSPWRFNLDS